LKWIVITLLAALALIGAGFLLTSTENSSVSHSPEALALCEEGTADQQAFRFQAAVDKLGRCLDLDPSLAEASISRARALAQLGRGDEARQERARADSLTALIEDPNRRMIAQLRLGGMQDSRYRAMYDSLMTRLQAEQPDDVFVRIAEAFQADYLGDADKRLAAWSRILEVNPNYANSYNMMGYIELAQGNYDQAIDHMQKYAFLAPDLANPHDSLGDVLMVLGRYEEAEEQYVKSVKKQPDFYASLINLGRVYVTRGQFYKGMDILEKVRGEIAGTGLERKVDSQIFDTYFVAGVMDEVDRMSAVFIDRYPQDGKTPFLRAMRKAYGNDFQGGQAIMDSTLAVWRIGDEYQRSPRIRLEIDAMARLYDALVADISSDPETRVRVWQNMVSLVEARRPFHEQWFERYHLAQALLDADRPTEALPLLKNMLNVNARLVNPLILVVECNLTLKRLEPARKALAHLHKTISVSDPSYPARAKAADLDRRVARLEGSL